MKIQYSAIILLSVLAGCNFERARPFTWDTETAQLTGKDLGKWLRQAPFSNEFGLAEEDEVVFNNARQVFPFIARYKNAVEELQYSWNDPGNPVYQQEIVLYQDPEWGDLFVSGTLLYDDQEVFLDRYYRESGNLAFDGTSAGTTTYSATLSETSVFAHKAGYKAGIYWANAAGKSYLLGFFQRNRLVLSMVIPLRAADTLASLSKLKEVNDSLGLQISEWETATVGQLSLTSTTGTFWKDPFTGIYTDEKYLLPRVYLKIKDTPLQSAPEAATGDYYFNYDGSKGPVTLYTVLKETAEDEQSFIETQEQLPVYKKNGEMVFYEENPAEGRMTGLAKAYIKQGEYLEIHFAYPRGDEHARKVIHGILENVKIHGLL